MVRRRWLLALGTSVDWLQDPLLASEDVSDLPRYRGEKLCMLLMIRAGNGDEGMNTVAPNTGIFDASMKASGRKIVVSINTSWNIVNFRSNLIRAMVSSGYVVVAAAPVDAHSSRLLELGCRHEPLEMDNKGTSPIRDLFLFMRYTRLLRRERPDIYLGWTIKPNIYGALASRLFSVPVVNNVSGLGTAFLRDSWLTLFVKLLYRAAFARSACVFFQNGEDRDMFVRYRLVRFEQTQLLPGSGIDLVKFCPAPQLTPTLMEAPVFLLVARLLWDKGVGEFVGAAKIVKARIPTARFRILGFLDVENRTAVPRGMVEQWVEQGIVEYLGETDDVRPHIKAADCVVLPSYREGTPRSLLEAAAMAKPIIATDVPGCREVVDDGINGWLCRVRDADDLAEKMQRFAVTPLEDRSEMGKQSRLKVEREFDERNVIDAYLAVIERVFSASKSADKM